jgi:hypothetical protein
MQKLKNTISYLLMVGFDPFQRGSLVYCRFASVGTREMVGRATTGGERGWDGLEDARAQIYLLSVVGGPAQKMPFFQMGCMGQKATKVVVFTHLMVFLKFRREKKTPSSLFTGFI